MFNGGSGGAAGILGGTTNLWAATQASPAPIYLGGRYRPDCADCQLPEYFIARVLSYNPSNATYTTAIGGAYYGEITSIMDNTPTHKVENGMVNLLYIDQNRNAGIITGSYTGSAYGKEEAWTGEGTMYPVPIVSGIGISPENLYNNITIVRYDNLRGASYLYTIPSSGFEAGGTFDVKTIGAIRAEYITGQYWGIKWMKFGGTYAGATSDAWRVAWEWTRVDYTSSPIMVELQGNSTRGTKWSDGRLEGTVYGYKGSFGGVNLSTGRLAGTFDPNVFTWQAQAMGSWMDVNTFLTMQATAAGQDALGKLNYPCVQVGTATLSGSVSGVYSVSLNNVKFFSNSAGAAPALWATNNVTGSYTALNTTTAVPLSGSGLTADFKMITYTTTNNKVWLGRVYNGSGTLSGGSYAGTVVFGGAAAGTINTTAKTFSGVAGGTARK
jgi:hypothetical protein